MLPRPLSRKRRARKIQLEKLEGRQLLAADLAGSLTVDEPMDVNVDGMVTPIDALMVINHVARAGRGAAGGVSAAHDRMDTNRDGNVTPIDALIVLNRIARPPSAQPPVNDPSPVDPPGDDLASDVRSIDGTDNNVANPNFGSAGESFLLTTETAYADGISEPSGDDRPSAREVSNQLVAQEDSVLSARNLSGLIYVFGQFIDHDLDLTASGDQAFNIDVPAGDPYFDPQGTGEVEIAFTRSAVAEGTGTDVNNPALQVNQITAFLDGSMIYGSDQETSDSLRTFADGQLTTSDGNLLPLDDAGFFLTGDIRANENPALTAMQTLWMREHNTQADRIAAENLDWTDEQIFQAARRVVIAELQAITYNEFLPALMGRDAMSDYAGYDESVDPGISLLFSTVGFRFGHSTLDSEVGFKDLETGESDAISLADGFFNPSVLAEHGVGSLLAASIDEVSQEIDPLVVNELRSFLFGPPGSGGLDLAALNIQRGRDHGLPDYNAVRQQLGLTAIESFADITSDVELQQKLQAVYGDVDSIDPWIGAMAEDHLPGSSLGELAQTILIEQFERTRSGDRFWYQNTFAGSELRRIEATTLDQVLQRNTEIDGPGRNVFFASVPKVDRPTNQVPGDSQKHHATPTPKQPVPPALAPPQVDRDTSPAADDEARRDRPPQNNAQPPRAPAPQVRPAAQQSRPASPADRVNDRPESIGPAGEFVAVDQFFGELGR